MDIFSRAEKAANYIKSKIECIPDTAIVLGSGLGAFGNSIEAEIEIPYCEIPSFPEATVAGHSGTLLCGKAAGKRILAMKGRFHAYEGHPMEEVTLYVRVFALLGIKNLILTNAAGAINTAFTPGDLMLITDQLSFFCESPLLGKNDERFGTRFPSMNEVYSRELSEIALKAAESCNISLKQGVYAYSKGPMYETPAEIRALRLLGADACGMSTVPEATVAVHCGIRVLGISCLTNMAAGILDKPLSHQEVLETGRASEEKFKLLMNRICENLI